MTYWPVAAALAPLVDWIYVFRGAAGGDAHLAGAILPQVQWRLRGSFAWQTGSGTPQPIPDAALFGPTTAAARLHCDGSTVVVGTGLFPEGWAALMPMPALAMRGLVCPLADLWPGTPLGQAPDPDASDDSLAARFEAMLLRRLPHARPADPRIAAIGRWANGPDHDIATLAARLGVSARQLDRICVSSHGLPPRAIANKHKILRMAAVLALGEQDNRRETWTSEYADQSHFIRHFRRFIGVTPTRFLTDPDCLVRDVMRARHAIQSAHPLGLASPLAAPR